jgi:uncharacterized protein YbjT (DUF2867 family)
MKSLLVTGATGFTGYEVFRQLVTAGSRPRLMVRRPRPGEARTWRTWMPT